ncbi:MAG: VWA domain-containing protein [Ardenticatenaceae bacterium]|nr:VWA domain-containing protein [Ardenticatenaceae bacterium]
MQQNHSQAKMAAYSSGLKGCRRLRLGCLFIIFIFFLAICGLLALLIYPRTAQAADEERPLTVWLLIDNSNSMFDKEGVGSDPDLLRLDAARLFLSYLGVDNGTAPHQAGVIFFGSDAVTAVPLTPLTDETQRATLFAQIAAPARQGWTDHLLALDLAQSQLNALPTDQRSAVILLTDGKPEWSSTPTDAELAAYQSALKTRSEVLAATQTPLFIILLANGATDSDPSIAAVWQPLWQTMSAATPSGAYFVAREAADLPGIYHDIAALLAGNTTEGIVFETAVPVSGTSTILTIPANLAQLTLVISKENPAQTVSVSTVDGQPIEVAVGTVRHAGGKGVTREEVWVIEEPVAGEWTVHIEGAGEVTIWQDSKAIPLTIATLLATTAATASPSAAPVIVATVGTTPLPGTATLAPRPTQTPLPTVLVTPAGGAPTDDAPSFRWLWIVGVGGLLLVSVTSMLLIHQAGQPPRLTGTLRLLHGAQTQQGHTVVELEDLNKSSVHLGCSPADILLPGAQAQVLLIAGKPMGETEEVRVRPGIGTLFLDGVVLQQERRLEDTAILDLGGIQVRYENLRLRRAQREQSQLLAQSPYSS